jgi:hypothetical protein
MRTSFHHQPEAQHPNFPLSTSRQADYPIFRGKSGREMLAVRLSHFGPTTDLSVGASFRSGDDRNLGCQRFHAHVVKSRIMHPGAAIRAREVETARGHDQHI